MQTSTVQATTTRLEPWPVIWRRGDVVLGFAALFLGFAAIITFVVITVGDDVPNSNIPAAWATLAFEVWLGLVVLLLARMRGISLREIGYTRPRRWGLIPIAVVGAYIGVVAYFAVIVMIEALGVDLEFLRRGNTIETEGDETLLLWMILGLSVVVAAPLSEELLFRGLIFRAFAGDAMRQRQRLLAIWLSGAAFAAFHLNISVLVPFTLVGALFAYVFRESRSLWTPTLAHAIFNGVSFVFTVADVV